MNLAVRHRLLVIGAALVVLLQICWPLTSGSTRAGLTVLTVVVFACVSVAHAALTFGLWWALRFTVITFVFSLALEALGVSTSAIFGSYSYSDQLGPKVFEVPLVIGLAWVMFSYLAWILSRTLTRPLHSRPVQLIVSVLIGAFTMTSWDLFLDPQMVSQGYWQWFDTGLEFPGTHGIGVHNYLGWLAATAVLMLLIALIPEPAGRVVDQCVPAMLLGWTWIGGIIGNLFFFGRPSVALVGGVAMGIVVVPYLIAVAREKTR